MYKKGTPLGIIFGVPLFIFCGFQHCIANVITMGVGLAFDWSLILCIIGNFFGFYAFCIGIQTEEIISDTDSLQQQAEVPDNE